MCTALQIAHEMDMICNIEKSSSLFEENWKKYVSIILKYSKTVQAKEIKAALENLDSFDDDNGKAKICILEIREVLYCMMYPNRFFSCHFCPGCYNCL